MKAVPVWVYYSVLRVLMFAVPLAILLALQIEWWISALVAALIGFCLSYILLSKPRASISSDLYEARHRDKAPVAVDDASEDEAVDRASALAETTAEQAAEQSAGQPTQREQNVPSTSAEQPAPSEQSAPSERESRSE